MWSEGRLETDNSAEGFCLAVCSKEAGVMSPLRCDALTSINRTQHCQLNIKKAPEEMHRDTNHPGTSNEYYKETGGFLRTQKILLSRSFAQLV